MSKSKINLETVITRRTDLPTTDLGGEIGMVNVELGKYFALNPVGTRIWELLEKPNSINGLVSILMEQYDVDIDTCTGEVVQFIENMLQLELITQQ